MSKKPSSSGGHRRRLQGIVDELVGNALNADATEVNASVVCKEDYCEIRVQDNGRGMDEEKAAEVLKMLKQPRRHELEEYYGDLAGISGSKSGLSIVGMLVDSAEVTSKPGEGTTIIVRVKN